MSTLVDDLYMVRGVLFDTQLTVYPDGDYGIVQEDEDRVYLNKQQAINYAKAILRNEGIHAID